MKRINDEVIKKKTKKKISGKIIVILAILLIAFALVIISSTCNIKKINVVIEQTSNTADGEISSSKITEEEIKSLSGVTTGENMFKKSKSVITENIKKNSYVKDVEVSKKLNGTLTITVTPRDAEYLINYAGAYIYIDSEGYLLEVNSEPTNIPILIGITTDFSALTGASSNSLAIDMLNENDLEKLKTVNNIVQSAKENSVYSLINTIDITDEKNYTLHLDSEGKTVYLGDCKDINTRILYLKAILEKESGNSGEVFINADLDTGYVYFKESN